jgi:hypothetical protein
MRTADTRKVGSICDFVVVDGGVRCGRQVVPTVDKAGYAQAFEARRDVAGGADDRNDEQRRFAHPWRVVYEQAVTLCWVAIDPESHHGRWRAHALASDSKLRADIERFGAKLDPIPEPDKSAVGLPSMDQRAEESDQHWHGKVAGLHAGTHLFSFRGLYAALYRTASRPAHASYGAVAEHVGDGARPVVVRSPAASEPGLAVLAVPLLGMTLAVLASRVQWINEDSVREIVGRLHVSG